VAGSFLVHVNLFGVVDLWSAELIRRGTAATMEICATNLRRPISLLLWGLLLEEELESVFNGVVLAVEIAVHCSRMVLLNETTIGPSLKLRMGKDWRKMKCGLERMKLEREKDEMRVIRCRRCFRSPRCGP
jgi:hypothetical protein